MSDRENSLERAIDRGIDAAERTISNEWDILETAEEIYYEIENE